MNPANRFAPAPVPAGAAPQSTSPIYAAKSRIDAAHDQLHNSLETLGETIDTLERRLGSTLLPAAPANPATGNGTQGGAGEAVLCRSPLADHLHATATSAEAAVDKVERLRHFINDLMKRHEA
jgi:hypothetical protein